jgi:dynactin 1
LSEENNKLREALRRLHTQSTADRSELEALKAAREGERSELDSLRKFKENAEGEMAELRQAVDAAASYESLIESLSEKNLDLTQKVSQLEVTVRDMEEQQELSEELDQQQRQELEHLRRQLDSASIQSAEKDSIIR